MSDRLRISRTWAQRFAEQKIAVPMLLRRAGLPTGLFQQEKVYLTTAELFALWRTIGEMASDPAIGLRLGAETRFERSHPAAIAVMCSRTFGDALERLGRYKKLTCPEEIRVHKKAGEAAVEFFYVEATEPQPDVLVDMGDMADTVNVTEAHKREVVALWSRYPALAKRVHVVASDIFVVPGPRVVEAAEAFGRMLHPETVR